MKFWIPWGFDALIMLVVLYFFFVGLADGSVSSFNAGLWFILLLVVGSIVGGSLWLRSSGRNGAAIVILLVLAVPGLVFALFILILVIANPRWN